MKARVLSWLTSRVPAPFFFAGAGVDGVDDAPVGDAVNGAVEEERRGFLIASAVADVVGPSEAKPADVGGVDLVERTVAGLALGEAVGGPFGAIFGGVAEGRVVHDVDGLGVGGNSTRDD